MAISKIERKVLRVGEDDEVISINKKSFEKALDGLIKTYKERGETELHNRFVNYQKRYTASSKVKGYFFRYYIINKTMVRFAMFSDKCFKIFELKNVQN